MEQLQKQVLSDTEAHYIRQEQKHLKKEEIVKELKALSEENVEITRAVYARLGEKYGYCWENILRIWNRYQATDYISVTNKKDYRKGIVHRNRDVIERQVIKQREWILNHAYPKKELIMVEDLHASRKIIAEIIYLKYCRFIPAKDISVDMEMALSQINMLCNRLLQYRYIELYNKSTREYVSFFQPNIAKDIEMNAMIRYMKEKLAIYRSNYYRVFSERYKHYVTEQIARCDKTEMDIAYQGILTEISNYLSVDELNAIDIRYANK